MATKADNTARPAIYILDCEAKGAIEASYGKATFSDLNAFRDLLVARLLN